MAGKAVVHRTFTIERRLGAPPAAVFRAFSSAARKRRWFAGGTGRKGAAFAMDFRPGGWERTRSRMGDDTPFPGAALANDTCYMEIAPPERIALAYSMSLNGRRFSVSLGTYEFLADGRGTKLVYTDQGAYFEGADGPRRRKAGWEALFDALAAELSR